MPVELPPRRALGDLAVPLAFELARRLRKAPRAIAQEIAAALGPIDGFSRVEAAPNGYVNFFLDRPAFARGSGSASRPAAASAARAARPSSSTRPSIPNKAAHIGHLRNAALGDAFGRLLRFLGRARSRSRTTSTTPASRSPTSWSASASSNTRRSPTSAPSPTPTRFDYYCWDLYARVTEWYEEDEDAAEDPRRGAARHRARRQRHRRPSPRFIADRIVRAHLKTMRRMNIGYDLLTWEGDILRLHFWTHAFEFLKKTGAVFLQTEGKLEGCWVMRIDDDVADGARAGGCAEAPPSGRRGRRAAEEPREKVIVRSDGTVTYVGKDMAYQLWKFGLLGKDFYYRVFDERSAPPLWSTTSDPAAGEPTAHRRSAARRGSATSSTRGRRTCRSC